jgi:hypothetical protein
MDEGTQPPRRVTTGRGVGGEQRAVGGRHTDEDDDEDSDEDEEGVPLAALARPKQSRRRAKPRRVVAYDNGDGAVMDLVSSQDEATCDSDNNDNNDVVSGLLSTSSRPSERRKNNRRRRHAPVSAGAAAAASMFAQNNNNNNNNNTVPSSRVRGGGGGGDRNQSTTPTLPTTYVQSSMTDLPPGSTRDTQRFGSSNSGSVTVRRSRGGLSLSRNRGSGGTRRSRNRNQRSPRTLDSYGEDIGAFVDRYDGIASAMEQLCASSNSNSTRIDPLSGQDQVGPSRESLQLQLESFIDQVQRALHSRRFVREQPRHQEDYATLLSCQDQLFEFQNRLNNEFNGSFPFPSQSRDAAPGHVLHVPVARLPESAGQSHGFDRHSWGLPPPLQQQQQQQQQVRPVLFGFDLLDLVIHIVGPCVIVIDHSRSN